MQVHDQNDQNDQNDQLDQNDQQVQQVQYVQHDTNAELASPGSESSQFLPHHITAIVSVAMAAILTTLGITGVVSSVSSINAVEPTNATAQAGALGAQFGMPTEMKVRALASTKSEAVRQSRLNRKAAKKHEVRQTRIKIVKTARAQIGDYYRAGRSGPDAFDCSGLVRYVFKKVTGKTLPHYSKAQYKHVRKIKKSQAQPGDLVFFFRNGAHHVGIYIGNNKMIDAPSAGKKVRISPITGSWWGRSYTGMGRILPA